SVQSQHAQERLLLFRAVAASADVQERLLLFRAVAASAKRESETELKSKSWTTKRESEPTPAPVLAFAAEGLTPPLYGLDSRSSLGRMGGETSPPTRPAKRHNNRHHNAQGRHNQTKAE